MEPQGRGNVPARHTPERNKRLGLSKTTLESRVHVQTSWAECRDKKVSASSRRGDFSLDIPFYRTPQRNKRLGLSKTTLESRVHVQTSWAECRDKKVSASSRRGDFSLDIPFYRTSPETGLIRSYRVIASSRTR